MYCKQPQAVFTLCHWPPGAPEDQSCVGTSIRSSDPLVKVSTGPNIQPEGAAFQGRPTGHTTLSAAKNRRKSETSIPSLPDARGRFARRLAAPPASGPADLG
eukprot:9210474-Alexandrium_andersonii.AAC.1